MSGTEASEFGATVSFENADGKTFSVHRAGVVTEAVREACGIAERLDDSFRVVCISTPTSIYTDLKGARIGGTRASEIVGGSQRPASPEAAMLGRVKLLRMLHPRLAS